MLATDTGVFFLSFGKIRLFRYYMPSKVQCVGGLYMLG